MMRCAMAGVNDAQLGRLPIALERHNLSVKPAHSAVDRKGRVPANVRPDELV
jgi:hypothetical protein